MQNKTGLIKSNWVYILWFLLYFTFAWLLLGATWKSFFITLILYSISIAIALSPMGEYILRKTEGARRIATSREQEYLLPIFEEVYDNAKEQNPALSNNIELHISDAMYVNAFALGKNTIAVTNGAIETFSAEELKGVIAHEFGHISNGDTKALLLNVVGNGIFGIMIMIAKFFMSLLEVLTSSFESTFGVGVVLMFLRWILDLGVFLFMYIGQIILSINSRQNEYLADKFAYTTAFGEELTEALYLLQKISIPGKLSLSDRIKASHPHLAERIFRLEKMGSIE